MIADINKYSPEKTLSIYPGMERAIGVKCEM